jgi:hypothetical protein
MKLLYPSPHQPRPNDALIAIRIARHSPCSLCDSCHGLHPPYGIEVVLDEIRARSSLGDLSQYGSDDDDGATYLDSCACGHTVKDHNADQSELDGIEFYRRSRVATRLDEQLQVSSPSFAGNVIYNDRVLYGRYGGFIFGAPSLVWMICCYFQDENKILDFDYINEDIVSLRKQMGLPRSYDSPPIAFKSPGEHFPLSA